MKLEHQSTNNYQEILISVQKLPSHKKSKERLNLGSILPTRKTEKKIIELQ
jgi:hypothetical protein